MNVTPREENAVASTGSARSNAPPSQSLSVELLLLAFLLNALVATGVVICFSQFRGVNLAAVLVLQFLTAVALALWAAHRILLAAIRTASNGDDPRGQLGLFELLCREWKTLRDGTPHERGSNPEVVFVATLHFVLLFVGSSAALCMEGANSWPEISPLVDVNFAISGGAVLFWILSAGRIRFRHVNHLICDAIRSPEASGIRWSLLIAGNLLTSAYGLVAISPFVVANAYPFAPVFPVLSLVPLAILGFSVVMILMPAVAILDENTARTNSD